jgi:hypothetical protein
VARIVDNVVPINIKVKLTYLQGLSFFSLAADYRYTIDENSSILKEIYHSLPKILIAHRWSYADWKELTKKTFQYFISSLNFTPLLIWNNAKKQRSYRDEPSVLSV